jgi:hypothetical protein
VYTRPLRLPPPRAGAADAWPGTKPPAHSQVDLDTARLELDLTSARAQQSDQHATRLEAALQAANQSVAAQQAAFRESQERWAQPATPQPPPSISRCLQHRALLDDHKLRAAAGVAAGELCGRR